MRALVFHISSLVGLLVLLNQLWNAAEIERTIFMAFGAGLTMYTALLIGFVMIQRIMAFATPSPADEDADPDAEPTAAPAGSGRAAKAGRAEAPAP